MAKPWRRIFFQLLEQIARPHDRFFGQPRHAVMMDDGVDVRVGIGREHRLADAGGHHGDAAADLGQRTHDLAAFHARQHDDEFVVDHGEIGGLARQVAQLAQIRHRLRREIAAAGEGRAHREGARADMPFRLGAVELHEAAVFQRPQQAMHCRGRQTGADGEIAQAIAFVVLGQRLDDRERAIDRLHAAVARVGLVVCTGFRLDGLAPDHVFLHRDLHPSVRQSASRQFSLSPFCQTSEARSEG